MTQSNVIELRPKKPEPDEVPVLFCPECDTCKFHLEMKENILGVIVCENGHETPFVAAVLHG